MTLGENLIRRMLNARGRKIFKELIITMCAGDEQVLSRVSLKRVTLRAEHYVSELPLLYFIAFKFALYLLQYSIPPISRKLRPFTWLSLEERLDYLDRWKKSSWYFKRMSFKMVQAVCVSHLYSERKLLDSIGFEASMLHRITEAQG